MGTEAEQAGCLGSQKRKRLMRQLCQAALASRIDEISLGRGCWAGNKSHVARLSSELSFTASGSLSMQISQLKPNTKPTIGLEWHHTAGEAGDKSICPLDSHQDEWKANQPGPQGGHYPRQCSWPHLVWVDTSSFLTDLLPVERCCPITTQCISVKS